MAGEAVTARVRPTTPNRRTWLAHLVLGCPVEAFRLIRDRRGLSVPVAGGRLLRCAGCGVYHELPTLEPEPEAVGPPPGVA